MLGILVGTASVVALVTSTRLSTDYAISKFKALGTNLISVNMMSGAMGENEASAAKLTLPEVHCIQYHRKLSQSRLSQVPGQVSTDSVDLKSPFVIGVTDEFFSILKIQPAQGRLVSSLDKVSPYCVLGHDVAKKFQNAGIDPIGKQIRIDNTLFTVVGVAKEWKKTRSLLLMWMTLLCYPYRLPCCFLLIVASINCLCGYRRTRILTKL